MTATADTVRAELARIATNVAVVTVLDAAVLHGVTANVWAEGAEPPLVLVTLRNEGAKLEKVMAEGRFDVNVLGADQGDLAVRFARSEQRAGQRFAGVGHRVTAGAPILDRVHAWVACAVSATAPFGSHTIVVGDVRQAGAGDLDDPLLYHGGAFGRLQIDGGAW